METLSTATTNAYIQQQHVSRDTLHGTDEQRQEREALALGKRAAYLVTCVLSCQTRRSALAHSHIGDDISYREELLEQRPLGDLGEGLDGGVVVLAVLRVDLEERRLQATRVTLSLWLAIDKVGLERTILRKMSPIGW